MSMSPQELALTDYVRVVMDFPKDGGAIPRHYTFAEKP